jgi:tetratricopeptide (TPR) repeat protein
MTVMKPLLEDALSRLDSGDLAGAERSCRKALRRRPGDAEATYLLALLRLRAGDAAQAAGLIGQALARGLKREAEVLENLGAAHLAAGDSASAVSALREALSAGSANPGPRLLMCLGYALAAERNYEEAETVLRRAWALAPRNAEIGINLGNVEAARGRKDSARDCYRAVLAMEARNVTAWFNMATLARDAGHFEEAADAYGEVLSIDPGHVDALNNLGTILERTNRVDEAVALYRRGLDIDRRNVRLLCNLGGALRRTDALGEAEQCCRQAIELQPAFVDAWITLAGIEIDRGHLDAARVCYRQALQLDPQDAEAEFFSGLLGLVLGGDRESWRQFRARPTRRHLERRLGPLDVELPVDLAGQSVLLLGEQGIGDELFFLRWAGELKRRGARVCALLDPKVHAMLHRTGIFDELRTYADPLPSRDFTVAVGDLPVAAAGPAAIPAGAPSLRLLPLEDRLPRMRALLQRAGKPPYLAVTWRAGTPVAQQRAWRNELLSKEIPIEILAQAVRGFPGTIISLQRNPAAGETSAFALQADAGVFDASAVNEDLEDMLALLSLIDEYAGVSNTNMHLLAGLGRCGRVLVPRTADWRWMASGRESSWFPGFRVYRRGASWDDAIAALRSDLRLTAPPPC